MESSSSKWTNPRLSAINYLLKKAVPSKHEKIFKCGPGFQSNCNFMQYIYTALNCLNAVICAVLRFLDNFAANLPKEQSGRGPYCLQY